MTDHFLEDGLEARAAFMGITPETGALLREFWGKAQGDLPDILDGFYRLTTRVPALADMVGEQIPRLKRAQQSHWDRLFSGRFDASYLDGVRAIGHVHNRIGLEPRWYIGGYAYILKRLTGSCPPAWCRSASARSGL